MNVVEAVKSIAVQQRVSMVDFARSEGVSVQAISKRCGHRDIKVSTLCKMLNVLGYRLVLVPRGATLPDGSIVVYAGDEEAGEDVR